MVRLVESLGTEGATVRTSNTRASFAAASSGLSCGGAQRNGRPWRNRVGGSSNPSPRVWVFHEFAGLVLAHRDSEFGALQISTAYRADCGDAPTPDCCEARARELFADTPIGAFVLEPLEQNGDWLGVANLGPKGIDGRVWYVVRDRQLALAARPTSAGNGRGEPFPPPRRTQWSAPPTDPPTRIIRNATPWTAWTVNPGLGERCSTR